LNGAGGGSAVGCRIVSNNSTIITSQKNISAEVGGYKAVPLYPTAHNNTVFTTIFR
jgi:hypothetical protein